MRVITSTARWPYAYAYASTRSEPAAAVECSKCMTSQTTNSNSCDRAVAQVKYRSTYPNNPGEWTASTEEISKKGLILILKTIGNRKGDCAWSCSRWQTQPEKICKSQRTNQCHSLRTLYWFVLCNLQIFSGCACHLEQLHAQSPFLFPIVFSINLIPFFDICSVDLLAVFQLGCSGMCYFTWAAARSQQLLFVVLAAGLWCLTAGCHVKSPLFPQPPLKQKCAPRSRWEKAYMRKHTYK